MSSTDSKTWLTTDAGRGMGVDFARAPLAGGHDVVATGRNTQTSQIETNLFGPMTASSLAHACPTAHNRTQSHRIAPCQERGGRRRRRTCSTPRIRLPRP
jgi:hypothetical protein